MLISPLGEGDANTGPAVSTRLDEDGRFAVDVGTVGKHRLVVIPADAVYSPTDGQVYACPLDPREIEVKAQDNVIDVELDKSIK